MVVLLLSGATGDNSVRSSDARCILGTFTCSSSTFATILLDILGGLGGVIFLCVIICFRFFGEI